MAGVLFAHFAEITEQTTTSLVNHDHFAYNLHSDLI
jgi:hypothetical protein